MHEHIVTCAFNHSSHGFSAPILGLRFHGLALALPLVNGSEVFWRVFLNRDNHVPAETRIDYISYHWCALRLYQLCWITPNPRETIVTCRNQTRFLPTMSHTLMIKAVSELLVLTTRSCVNVLAVPIGFVDIVFLACVCAQMAAAPADRL